MGSETFAAGTGVYCLQEILFLRNVVRESTLDGGGHMDHREAEQVARRVLDAYGQGIRQRAALIEIARCGSSLH